MLALGVGDLAIDLGQLASRATRVAFGDVIERQDRQTHQRHAEEIEHADHVASLCRQPFGDPQLGGAGAGIVLRSPSRRRRLRTDVVRSWNGALAARRVGRMPRGARTRVAVAR